MKKVIKEYNVYNYEELSKEAKEKAFKLLEEVIIDGRFSWLEEFLTDELREAYGIDGRISYDLSYSQGSGLSFDCDEFLTKKTIDILKEGLNEKESDILLKLWQEGSVNTKNGGRYAYASGYQVYINEDMIEGIDPLKDITSEEDKKLFNAFHVVRVKIIKLYLSICGELEKQGYKVYEVSEEDVIEDCLNNDITFFEDGRIFNL